ncbi:MAG: TonB-dependent receptor [Pseudomonadota bacterium]
MRLRQSLFFCQSLFMSVVVSSFSSIAVNAQDAGGFLEEVVVTASKRQQTLQDTPIAIHVTSSMDIDQAKVLDIADLQTLVPTLRVSSGAFVSSQSFSIRGFGSPTQVGTEPSVGVYVDGVFRSRATGAITDLPRLERVEVLSGPQSTLFGKNASAGVISIVTAPPRFEREGKFEFGIGNYSQKLLKGSISGGISDQVAMSLSGSYNERDGYTEALIPGVDDLDSRNRWSLRSQLLWMPSDEVTLRLIADYSNIDEICCSQPDVLQGPVADVVESLGGLVLRGDPFDRKSTVSIEPQTEVEDSGLSAHLDLEFDSFELTSISAFRRNEVRNTGQVGGESLLTTVRAGGPGIEFEAFSQELRLTSTGDGSLQWIVGGFYYEEEAIQQNGLIYGPDLRPVIAGLVGGEGLLALGESLLGLAPGTFFREGILANYEQGQDNTGISAFANVDYELNDDWTATVGLNYTKDKKEAFLTELANEDVFSSLNLAGTPLSAFAPLQFRPPIVEFPNVVEEGKSNDSDTTYILRLAYTLNDKVNMYVSRATGFKSSSWDLSNFSRPRIEDALALDASGINSSNPKYGSRRSTPEYATVHEFGAKLLFDRFSLNVAVFQQTLEDFQVRSFDGVDFFQANAGETSVDGIEFDARYSPTEHWTFTLAGTLLDPIYDEFTNAPPGPGDDPSQPKDLSGTKPANIPSTSLAFGVLYNHSFANGTDAYVRADYQYESSVKLSDLDPSFERQVNNLGMSMGFSFENNMRLQVWGRNLTDDENLLTIFGAPAQTGTISAFVNTPRTYGVTLEYTFN